MEEGMDEFGDGRRKVNWARRASFKIRDFLCSTIADIWTSVCSNEEERPLWHLLLPLFLLLWFIDCFILSFSSWVPLFVIVWAAAQHGKYQRRILVEELNNRWKQHILNRSPNTCVEPCEWLNKLIYKLWSNYLEPRLSQKFSTVLQRRFKGKKPRSIQSIELQEFYLGVNPPTLGLQRTYWAEKNDIHILHMGFEWDTTSMNALLAAKLVGPFKGMARISINSLHIKGDIQFIPILDGQAVLYSFETTPEVRVGLAFGRGQALPETEVPGAPSWLEKIFIDTLIRTMVEPRRRCFCLPVENLRRRATGADITITDVSGSGFLMLLPVSKSISGRKTGLNGSSRRVNESSRTKPMHTLVEVASGDFTRRTSVNFHSGSPTYGETFNLFVHGNSGAISFNVYEKESGSGGVNYRFLGTSEVKIQYADDGSTVYWALGKADSFIAARAEYCGKQVDLTVPIEGNDNAEISLKLVVSWHFGDNFKDASIGSSGSQRWPLSSWPSLSGTGRTLRVTVAEGRNLAAKDFTGKSDPYVQLRYGKTVQRTKTIQQDLNPIWNEVFEFQEIEGEEYLMLKCYDEDFLTDEALGSARINLEGLEDGSSKDIWMPLEKISSGEIRLVIEAEKDSEGSQGSDRGRNGVVELVLLEARDLVGADWGGTSDPFVSVHYGNSRKRTKVIHKTVNPKWNQTLEFADTGRQLALYVKDHNTVLPTSNIGSCKIDYQSYPPNQTVEKWFPLQGVRKGEIHVQITRRSYDSNGSQNSNDAGSSSSNMQQKVCEKMRMVLKEAQELADGLENGEIQKKLEELESIEDEQDAQISQLLQEKELLLSKIKELGKVMEGVMEVEAV